MIKFVWTTQQIDKLDNIYYFWKIQVDFTITFYPSCFSFSYTTFPNRLGLGSSDGLSFLVKTETNVLENEYTEYLMYTESVKQNSPEDYIMHPHYSQHNLTYTLTIPTIGCQDSYTT